MLANFGSCFVCSVLVRLRSVELHNLGVFFCCSLANSPVVKACRKSRLYNRFRSRISTLDVVSPSYRARSPLVHLPRCIYLPREDTLFRVRHVSLSELILFTLAVFAEVPPIDQPTRAVSPHRVLLGCGYFDSIRRSFGGVVLLKLMEELANDDEDDVDKEDKAESSAAGGTGIRVAMAGGAFLCSVPPSGNGPMTKRFIKEVLPVVHGVGCLPLLLLVRCVPNCSRGRTSSRLGREDLSVRLGMPFV